MYNLALIYVRLRTGGTYTPYQHHCQVSSNFTAKTILSPLGLERKVMASKNKSTLTLKGLSTSSGREQLLSTLGSPYSQLPDIKLSLPYPLQCFSKCLQDSVDMALQAFMLNQSPRPHRGCTLGHAEALSCRTGHLFKFLPFWFSPCSWGSLMWGPFPPHVGTLPSSQNPSSGSGSPYPDPWTQGAMAGCRESPWTCGVCMC